MRSPRISRRTALKFGAAASLPFARADSAEAAGVTGWSDWTLEAGPAINPQLCAITDFNNGYLEVFCLDTNGNVIHNWQQGAGNSFGGWNWPLNNPGTPIQNICVAQDTVSGYMILFGVDAQNNLWRISKNASNPSGWDLHWTLMSGTDVRAIACGTDNNGMAEVFYLNSAGVAFHSWELSRGGPFLNDNTANQQILVAGGQGGIVDFAIGQNSDGHLEFLGLDAGGTLWHAWGPSWPTLASLGGQSNAVTSGRSFLGCLHARTINTVSQLWIDSQTIPSADGWGFLAGPTFQPSNPGLIKQPSYQGTILTSVDNINWSQLPHGGGPLVPVETLISIVAAMSAVDGTPNMAFFQSESLGDPRQLQFHGTWVPVPFAPEFSVRANSLAFARNRDGRAELFCTAVDSSGLRQLYHCWMLNTSLDSSLVL